MTYANLAVIGVILFTIVIPALFAAVAIADRIAARRIARGA